MNSSFKQALKHLNKCITLSGEARLSAKKAAVASAECEQYLIGCCKLSATYRQWQHTLQV